MVQHGSGRPPGRVRAWTGVAIIGLAVWVLVAGSIGAIVQGDFQTAGIALLLFAILLALFTAPFARLPPGRRIVARVATTGLVMSAWFVAGAVAWNWSTASYAVAGVIAVVALAVAAVPAGSRRRDSPSVASGERADDPLEMLARGDRVGAGLAVDANLAGEPSSLQRRWDQALVYGRIGLVQPGLDAALALRETEIWPAISLGVCDLALWAGRPEVGVSILEKGLDFIEDRDDINALGATWQNVGRTYLGLAWAAGTAAEAEARLAKHAELRDSGWRLNGEQKAIVWGPGQTIVETFLPGIVAAVTGRHIYCPEWTDDYNQMLETLFGLAHLPPHEAWAKMDELQAQTNLSPIGPAYRAQIAARGGDAQAAQQWMHNWFAEPQFPMTVADLVVTGLLRYFVTVRHKWVAAASR